VIEEVVVSTQSSVDPTLILGGDVSLDHVVFQYIQPMVEEVIMLMQSSVDPNFLFGSEPSFDYVFRISS